MCNINVLITTNNKLSKKRIDCFIGATSHSYATNTDGIGYYFVKNDTLITSPNFIPFSDLAQHTKNETAIFNHTRLTTSGLDRHNIQPFKKKGYLFLHNGVLINYDSVSKDSDSLQYFDRFLAYKKQGYSDVKAIKTLFNQEKGSYSIVILNTITKTMYYCKNAKTTIKFYSGVDLVYITTNLDNIHFFNEKLCEVNIKNHKIYEIELDKGEIYEVGDIIPAPYNPRDYYSRGCYNNKYYTDYYEDKEIERLNREAKKLDEEYRQKELTDEAYHSYIEEELENYDLDSELEEFLKHNSKERDFFKHTSKE